MTIEWKVEFKSYEQQGTMPLDRAKIEAQRHIAEQLDRLNQNIESLIHLFAISEKSLRVK